MECVTIPQYSIAINGGIHRKFKGKRESRQGDPISPLIFVICMEYFTIIKREVGNNEVFQFHTKCKNLRLNHLCFADDMLIFSKGEFNSVLLMLRGLKSFSMTSGLTTNASKSNIYAANMEGQVITDLCELTEYSNGKLPFRYLGVPVSSKKLSSVECEMLVEPMPGRIKACGSKNLSYAGRKQLVNTVLLHIRSYWAMFI